MSYLSTSYGVGLHGLLLGQSAFGVENFDAFQMNVHLNVHSSNNAFDFRAVLKLNSDLLIFEFHKELDQLHDVLLIS